MFANMVIDESGGFFKVYRKLLESDVYHDPLLLKVWIWILGQAAWKEHSIPFRGDRLAVKPGQFVTGLNSAAESLRCGQHALRSRLDYLVKTGRITMEPSNKFRIITVCNWETYQSNGQTNGKQTANNGQTTGKPRATTEECKECKEGKEGKKTDSFASASAKPAATKAIPIVFLPEERRFTGATDKDKATWTAAFPGVDQVQEVHKAIAWIMADWPRRTRKNWRKFLTNWFSKAQETAGRGGWLDEVREPKRGPLLGKELDPNDPYFTNKKYDPNFKPPTTNNARLA